MKTIKTILSLVCRAIIDAFLPQSKEVKMLLQNGRELLKERESLRDAPFGALAIFEYRDPLVKTLVWEIKYRGNMNLTSLASEFLLEELTSCLSEAELFQNFTDPILIPIPLSPARSRERGFNQCERIAEAMEKTMKKTMKKSGAGIFTLRKDILMKKDKARRQTETKNKTERVKNIRGSFVINANCSIKASIKGRNIILLDDVVTTGATLEEASRVLKAAGARKILKIALAH